MGWHVAWAVESTGVAPERAVAGRMEHVAGSLVPASAALMDLAVPMAAVAQEAAMAEKRADVAQGSSVFDLLASAQRPALHPLRLEAYWVCCWKQEHL